MTLNLSCFSNLEISTSNTFSLPEIYSVILNPSTSVYTEMGKFFNDIGKSASDLTKQAYTGDVNSNDQLHRDSSFEWLTDQLTRSLFAYIDSNLSSHHNFDVFCQKSWPVILRKGNSISPHKHNNAHLSAVYYYSCPSNAGGNIIFSSSSNFFPSLGTSHQPKDRFLIGIKPFTNLLLIFPSSITHHVTSYNGAEPRLSISFDIFLAASASSAKSMRENISTNPLEWSLLGD